MRQHNIWCVCVRSVWRGMLDCSPAPIQSPAKGEVRSVIWFLNAKGERPAETHKQIVAVYGNVMNRQNVTKWCREFSEGMTDVHDEQRSGRPSQTT